MELHHYGKQHDLYTPLCEQLIRHEGLKLKPYRCPAGKLTIAVGRNLDDNGISEQEAMSMLLHDVQEAEAELCQFEWWAGLSIPRKIALLNMRFNLGLPRFCGFKKMLAALDARDFGQAASEMLDSKWAKQVGDRASELATMMEEG